MGKRTLLMKKLQLKTLLYSRLFNSNSHLAQINSIK